MNCMKKTPTTDLFADIGAGSVFAGGREGLERPEPVASEGKAFPMTPCKNSERPPHALDLCSYDEFRSALADLKERMRPFTRNLAPEIPRTREAHGFKHMNWRLEEPADRIDFAGVLAGGGKWQQVNIPHYGGPLGLAVTLYRCAFTPPTAILAKPVAVLCFDAVDYRCQVYLNGVCVATHEGIFEPFEVDVSGVLRSGENILLVRVENDHTMLGKSCDAEVLDGDKIYAATGLGYDDPEQGWHHCPPGMGIWQRVRLEGRQRMAITDIFVRPNTELNAVEVEVEVAKYGAAELERIALGASIFGRNFDAEIVRDFHHEPSACEERGFGDLDHGTSPEIEPLKMGRGKNKLRLRLEIPEARVWELETPWLYELQLRLLDEDANLLDAAGRSFGMRTFVQDETAEPKGRFLFNGREIRLRGANTMGNIDLCVFRGDVEQLEEDILIAKLTHMNFLRLTQHPVQREVYEACDRLGLFLQTDLPTFGSVRHNQVLECVRQAAAMERLVRCHPSSILVSFINEPFPAARGRPHRFIDRAEMERFFKMARLAVLRENPDRVIKNVDGDYDPPTAEGMQDNHCYCGWYIGHGLDLGALHAGDWLPVKEGWHYGCGEFGSEGLDSLEVMESFYPREWLPASQDERWVPDAIIQAQTAKFHGLWYPTPRTLPEWIEASQKHQDWITRLMTESFRRNPGMNTFAIHLFIDAWPSGWMKSIMDVKRIPKKAWFTYRHALSPLAVQLRSDRTSGFGGETIPVELWTANDNDNKPTGMRVAYAALSDGRPFLRGEADIEPARCAPVWHGELLLKLPEVDQRGEVELTATLIDADNRPLHTARLSMAVFPSPNTTNKAVFFTDGGPAVEQLLGVLGLPLRGDTAAASDCIVISDVAFYERNRPEIDAAIEAGGRAVFLKIAEGVHRIGEYDLEVLPAGMGARHFVSKDSGHAMVADFRAEDFKFWFDQRERRVTPILFNVLKARDWQPILLTTNGGWGNVWESVPAAVERRQGEGMWRVCQVDLFGRVLANPAAGIFTLRLLGADKAEVSSDERTYSGSNERIPLGDYGV